MNVIGLILMGGKNSRMNGEKKALLKYKDKYFWQCISEAMLEAGVEQIYASVETVWQGLGLTQVVDEYHQIGPLGGIITALEKQESDVDGILVTPCDLPRISPLLIKRLLDKFEETKLPVVIVRDGMPNPLVAIYTFDCIPVLKKQIAEGNYRARQWIGLIEHAEILLDENEEFMLFNINSEEDYKHLTENS